MATAEILKELKALGQESIKKVLLKHDIKEPLYGVKIEELKKIQKRIKKDHGLSMALYDTGVYDARYLAGLIADPEKTTKKELQHWVETANAPILYETVVSGIAAESPHGMELAMKWIKSKDKDIVTAGWSTLSHIVSLKDDKELDIPLLKELLQTVAENIHESPNRVKSVMNAFVICVGSYVKELNDLAKKTAQQIGKVAVDVGDTACKVPLALDYIKKVEARGNVGKKKKNAIC